MFEINQVDINLLIYFRKSWRILSLMRFMNSWKIELFNLNKTSSSNFFQICLQEIIFIKFYVLISNFIRIGCGVKIFFKTT